MAFAGMNYLAIVIAAVAAWLLGAVWYTSLADPWKAALGLSAEQLEACKNGPTSYLPFFYVFASNLVMAWVLAGVLAHLGQGQVTIRNGIISGLFCWLGFVITTMLANYSFGMRKPMLLVIDGAHWLLVLVLMGAIIGGMGV